MRSSVKNKKFLLIITAFLLLSALIAYGSLFSPLFKIKNIKSTGLPRDNKQEIADSIEKHNILFGLIPPNNLLFIQEKWFTLLQSVEIKKISIEKNFFKRELLLNFEPRKEILSWCSPTENPEKWQCFYSDDRGILFKELLFIESPEFIQIQDFSGQRPGLGDTVDPKIINFAQKISESSKNQKFIIYHFTIENYESGDIIGYAPSFKIIFNTKNDPINQIRNLFAVLKEISQDDYDKLSYVNITDSNNKVWWK